MSQTIERVKRLIAEHLSMGADEIEAHDNLITDLGMDEMDFLHVMLSAEHELSIELVDRDSFNITVAQFAADVDAALANKHLVAA